MLEGKLCSLLARFKSLLGLREPAEMYRGQRELIEQAAGTVIYQADEELDGWYEITQLNGDDVRQNSCLYADF